MRTGASIIAVALGVAVLFAGLATEAGIASSVDEAVRAQIGRADLRVAAFDETGLSPSTVATIATTPGVDEAAPVFEQRIYLGQTGDKTTLPAPVTILGIDPSIDPIVHDLMLGSGTSLTDPNAPFALISERLAREDGLSLGSQVSMQGAGDRVVYRVVGILAGDGSLAGTLGRTVVVPLATAQAVFGTSGVDRVDILVSRGADANIVSASLESRLSGEPYVLSTPHDLAAGLRASTNEFLLTTGLIAAVALFSGAFLIFNALSMTVSERVREIGLLRAAGASRGQVMSFMLAQALVIGVVGSLAGLLVGGLLAAAMVAAVGTVGSVALHWPGLPLDAMAAALLVGIGVTLAAALGPARRASRIQPVEALKTRFDARSVRGTRLRWLAAIFVVIALAGVVFVPRVTGGTGAVGSLAVYGILLLTTLLIPVVLPVMARIAGMPFHLILRVEERLARSAIGRDPSRTALTLGSLTVGLAMIVALGSVGQHARAAASGWIEDVVPGGIVLTSIRPIAPDEDVAGQLTDAVPGIDRVSPIATFDVAITGIRTDAAAVVGSDLSADGRLRFTAGDRETALAALDTGGATIIPAAIAGRFGLAVGDVVTLPTADGGSLDLRVVGIVERSLPGKTGESMLIGWTDAMDRLGVAGADAFAVRFGSGAAPANEAALRATADLLALQVVPLDQIEGAISVALERIFGLFDALALVAVLIAALGIVNTLSMNVMERVREIGILRAAGMSRSQVWRSIVVEAGVLGLAGALLGIMVGLGIGALMVVSTGDTPDLGTSVPWAIIGLTLVIGVGLAMLAAAYPARIASRLSIVRAVQYE